MNKAPIELIDKKEYYNNLFDYYECLFTDKQKEYFRDYYFFDLSLSEIALNYNISRSAVYDVISKVHIQLEEYEEKLNLYKKACTRNELYDKYEKLATNEKEIDSKLVLEFINKLKENE